jgi:predicted GNAT family acetyltransferase
MIEVVDVADAQRYEARRDGTVLGFAAYQRTAELTVFTHTEIDRAFEGQGVGGVLVKAALDDVRERKLKVLAVCPFVEGWMRRHPEYAGLDYRAPKSSATD